MSLDDVYRVLAGGTRGQATCPAPVPAPTRMVEPLGQVGHMGHQKTEGQQDKAELPNEVETLLTALSDAGCDLGPELAHRLRERLSPLSRQVRAELVAMIDDAFEAAPNLASARQHTHRMLSTAEAWERVSRHRKPLPPNVTRLMPMSTTMPCAELHSSTPGQR